MLEHGIIERGDKKVVDGASLPGVASYTPQWARADLPRGPNVLEHRTVCLGVDDHLPREMTSTSRSGTMEFCFQ